MTNWHTRLKENADIASGFIGLVACGGAVGSFALWMAGIAVWWTPFAFIGAGVALGFVVRAGFMAYEGFRESRELTGKEDGTSERTD